MAEKLAISRPAMKDFGFTTTHTNYILESALIHDVANRTDGSYQQYAFSDSVSGKFVNYAAERVPYNLLKSMSQFLVLSKFQCLPA